MNKNNGETSVKLFVVYKLKQFIGTNDTFSTQFVEDTSALENSDIYQPILLNDYIASSSTRHVLYEAAANLKNRGFPSVVKYSDIYFFALPTQGPHSGLYFIWKQPPDEDSSPEQGQNP